MMKRMEKQLLLNSFSDIVKLSIETIQRVYNIEYAFLYTFSYVTYFNDAMGASMVFDFFQSSFQIAAILTQVLGNQITWVMFVFVSTFFVSMVFRLILYYYHANDVMYLSQRLSYSIWEANWFEQPNRLKRMILMFILRTQKPLTYRIGIFSVMTLQSCIYILRATYSYITLMVGYN
uniref:Odorant receptor n=1 Tax=Dendroctonus ponderosae TaxID=77166 RepID=A0AAR5PJW5_DENPD